MRTLALLALGTLCLLQPSTRSMAANTPFKMVVGSVSANSESGNIVLTLTLTNMTKFTYRVVIADNVVVHDNLGNAWQSFLGNYAVSGVATCSDGSCISQPQYRKQTEQRATVVSPGDDVALTVKASYLNRKVETFGDYVSFSLTLRLQKINADDNKSLGPWGSTSIGRSNIPLVAPR